MNKHKFTSTPSVDTTSVLSLLNAAYSLFDKKIKAHPVFKPRTLLVMFTILSVGVPLSTWPTRIVGRFPFWFFWLMVFYGTIWSFGYFNRSYAERITQNKSHPFTVTRILFLFWFITESIAFLLIGWVFVPIRGPVALFVTYFLLFAVGGLIYGLGDATCPHCTAINSGNRIKSTENRTDYQCLVCKKEFSHDKSL